MVESLLAMSASSSIWKSRIGEEAAMASIERALGVALLLLVSAAPAVAHNPIVIGGGHTNAATAHAIEDIGVSRIHNVPVLNRAA